MNPRLFKVKGHQVAGESDVYNYEIEFERPKVTSVQKRKHQVDSV